GHLRSLLIVRLRSSHHTLCGIPDPAKRGRRRDAMTVKDKVVAITGAARGMGRAYVEGFLAEGAKVVAMDRSWEPTGASGDEDDSFRRSIEKREDVVVASADITDAEQVEDAYRQATARFGTVDVLINNAGMRQRDLFPPTGRITTLETKD